jgi:hypothetical protein
VIIRIIKLRKMRWAGHGERMGEKRNVYQLSVGNLEGKETTRKTKKTNIKMDLSEIELGGVDWIGLAQDTGGELL